MTNQLDLIEKIDNAAFFFYDTESSGLPLYKEPSESPGQPHIVDFAGILTDIDGNVLAQYESLVRPDGWTISQETIDIHGITNELAADEGKPEHVVVAKFLEMQALAECRVGHNEAFDQRIMRIGIKRFGGRSQGERDIVADQFKARPRFCTMNSSKRILLLPPTEKMKANKRMATWNKAPSLQEAYEFFFPGEKIEGAHRAMTDTRAAMRVFFAVREFQIKAGTWVDPVTASGGDDEG